MTLESKLLDKVGGFIGGQWIAESPGGCIEVINHATGAVLARLPNMGTLETAAAVEAAERSLSLEFCESQIVACA